MFISSFFRSRREPVLRNFFVLPLLRLLTLCWLLCLLTNNVCAQSTPVVVSSDRQLSKTDSNSHGVQWTTGLSWEQVKQKAQLEKKYIFLDCLATWCGPCKMM